MNQLAPQATADPRADERARRDAACARPTRSRRPMRSTAIARVVVAMLALGTFAACENPCEDLHKRVCEDPAYLRENKRHCELMSEQNRREALPKDYCESILKSIQRR